MTQNDGVKVSGIVIEINGKEFKLSVEQARALRNELNDLFDKKVELEFPKIEPQIPKPYEYPRDPWPPYPWITYVDDTSGDYILKMNAKITSEDQA